MTQSTSALYFRAVFSSKLPVMVCSEHRFSTFWLVYFQILLLYHISTISRNVEILKLKFVNSRSAKLSFKFSIHQFSFSNTFICLLSIDFCLSTSLSLSCYFFFPWQMFCISFCLLDIGFCSLFASKKYLMIFNPERSLNLWLKLCLFLSLPSLSTASIPFPISVCWLLILSINKRFSYIYNQYLVSQIVLIMHSFLF